MPRRRLTIAHSATRWVIGPAFPNSAGALAYLAQFYKLVILSNVDRASFAQSQKRLGVAFDMVYTAEDIGSYKPDLRNFRHMIDGLQRSGHPAHEILHTAQSLFHDHAPANAVGLRSVWIDRRGGATGSPRSHGATPPPPEGYAGFLSCQLSRAGRGAPRRAAPIVSEPTRFAVPPQGQQSR